MINKSLEIDLKEITFSKYFNQNVSQYSSGDKSAFDTNASTPTKYQSLQILIKEARFTKMSKQSESLSSSVLVIYGNQRFQTKLVRNDQMNPRWHENINITLCYQGLAFFPDTLEIMVISRNEHIGKTVLSLREMLAETSQIDDWFCLVDQIQITGSICLSFQFLKSPISTHFREDRYSQSCYENPRTKELFSRKDVQGKPLDEQLQTMMRLAQVFRSRACVRFENQKQHPKSHGSIVSKYLQTNKPKSNEDNIPPQLAQLQLTTITQLIEQIRQLSLDNQQQSKHIQQLNSQNLLNNTKINEHSYQLQTIRAESDQAAISIQTMKDQLIIHQIKTTEFTTNQKQLWLNGYRRRMQTKTQLESILQTRMQVLSYEIESDDETVVVKESIRGILTDPV